MLQIYLFKGLIYGIIPWVLQVVAYFLLLRRMNLTKWTAVIPFLAERQFTKVLYRRMRTFYRPFVLAGILAIAGIYLGPEVGYGRMLMIAAALIYGIFLIRLYWRLGKSFGKNPVFRIFMILMPHIFLLILGFGRAAYTPLPLKPLKERSRKEMIFRRAVLIVISAVEIVAIVAGLSLLIVRTEPPEIFVNFMMQDTMKDIKDVSGTGDVVTREDAMGNAAATIRDIKPSRDKFFPNHSRDEKVVVMTYIVGSNLENSGGLASVNIDQMKEATKAGDGLEFVVEAGGSKRWFTRGIENASYGRYTISDGKINQVKKLPDKTCMSEPRELADFINWARDNYEADRYMLVLWDHGGGVADGYGQDDLHKRKHDKNNLNTITTAEVVNAVKQANMKFDLIGFDACLMQDIEIAKALEPYADYYLASEETEGGYGWFYTTGFGMLASDPGTPTEDFGREIIACYDSLNRALNSDKSPETGATLSFVDLTLAAPAYDKLENLLEEASEEIRDDTSNYANMAVAADNAYTFESDIQIDLIDFLKILDKVDLDNQICSHKEKQDIINSIRASILFRNGDSAKGINGMSVAFPYKSMSLYSDTSDQLGKLGFKSEKKTFDEIFSIMAAQQKKDREAKKSKDFSITALKEQFTYIDGTKQSWYIEGFEDYDDTKAYVDIPLLEGDDGYEIQLPEKVWKIVSDCQTAVYQDTASKDSSDIPNVRGASSRYLGSDQVGGTDKNGHPTIGMDNYWVHINGSLVCYQAEPAKTTDDGDVFTGTVRARLNDVENITLHIEWDPVKSAEKTDEELADGQEETASELQGRVTGYEEDSILGLVQTKGLKNLQAGDTIQFIFDYYDKEGNLVKSAANGDKIRITKQGRLEVKDEPIGTSNIRFGGVLTDVYQRSMTTEQIEMHVGD